MLIRWPLNLTQAPKYSFSLYNMKLLIIGPLPAENYTTGQAAAVQLLYEAVQQTDKVALVNLTSRGADRGIRFFRIIEAIQIAWSVWLKSWSVDRIYFTVSESLLGNLKDFLVYLVCFRRLDICVIHLHGGQGMRQLLKRRNTLVFFLNRAFLSRIARAIVLGDSQRDIFAGCMESGRIKVVPNFAEAGLFLSSADVLGKYETRDHVRVLFLSNLIEGKGHEELLNAYFSLDDSYRQRLKIDFAGHLPESIDSRRFLIKMAGISNLRYLGPVFGEKKKSLFRESHVFCLPTYYAYEGQPISILEAYASGCAVITTYHSGIVDIFKDGENGYVVETRSVDSLRRALERVCDSSTELSKIGLLNSAIASEKYTTRNHLDLLVKTIKA